MNTSHLTLHTNRIPTTLFQRALLLACLVVSLGGVGCQSTGGPASASFASVTIPDRSDAEIRRVAAIVFRENGYNVFEAGPMLKFEKEGTRGNTVAWDGVAAAQAGASTLVRVKAEVVDLGTGSHRLQCQAYMVSGAGDSFFEEEHRLVNIRSRPYQKILDDIADRLKQP